jgi:hypothetical protein
VNSVVSLADSMLRKIASTTRGVMPGDSRLPVIVQVLPLRAGGGWAAGRAREEGG